MENDEETTFGNRMICVVVFNLTQNDCFEGINKTYGNHLWCVHTISSLQNCLKLVDVKELIKSLSSRITSPLLSAPYSKVDLKCLLVFDKPSRSVDPLQNAACYLSQLTVQNFIHKLLVIGELVELSTTLLKAQSKEISEENKTIGRLLNLNAKYSCNRTQSDSSSSHCWDDFLQKFYLKDLKATNGKKNPNDPIAMKVSGNNSHLSALTAHEKPQAEVLHQCIAKKEKKHQI
ncbi:hypothetical protein EGR_08237 [Echinococcus granulosus]|uniref:Uncharacterized protein n=1 Tax=Echinococcus granulosus TaxID=6210 RepID=W6U6P7_ECHGR|nr:hypothetical protein EGR_08237 [Echinococcus granulosus]EUB56885.1 hypothetical protein EGR_08237 [Echinococcus granulosus]